MKQSRASLQWVFPLVLGGLLYVLNLQMHQLLVVVQLVGGMYLGQVLLLLDERVLQTWYHEEGAQTGLLTRSTLFLLAYVPLALFVLTSSGSLIGIGLILGIGITLATEMLQLRRNPEAFGDRFLRQLKRPLTPSTIQQLAVGFTLFVLAISVLSIL